ncbi:hypothetical protein Syun_027515 [Stephania yunnanensis]|uniref:Uncharacterized protein n=1 Tax=Stephania yunnanensis TaxID=152371 RepID=A0AAP0EPL3_9MAGN
MDSNIGFSNSMKRADDIRRLANKSDSEILLAFSRLRKRSNLQSSNSEIMLQQLQATSGGQCNRTGGLSVSLVGPDGCVLGGGVARLLTAKSLVRWVDPHRSSKKLGLFEELFLLMWHALIGWNTLYAIRPTTQCVFRGKLSGIRSLQFYVWRWGAILNTSHSTKHVRFTILDAEALGWRHSTNTIGRSVSGTAAPAIVLGMENSLFWALKRRVGATAP